MQSMGREYADVISVLRSRIQHPDDESMRADVQAFGDTYAGDQGGGISGMWVVAVVKGWCLLRVGSLEPIVVRAGGVVAASIELERKVRGVGERIRETLLPIQQVVVE